MVKVWITPSEMNQCYSVSERRHEANSDPNRPNRNANTNPVVNRYWEFRGTLGELACARYMGMEWTGETGRGFDVGGCIEVRTTGKHLRLAVVHKDFTTHTPDTPFVSAVWEGDPDEEGTWVTLRGWLPLGEVQDRSTFIEVDGHSFWAVETKYLRPMTQLEHALL